jgi:2-desacetyl-2-hydroxyethyl bacteriochlorophyllide A dehydrogenase
MKAIVCRAPNQLSYEDVAVPEIGPGEALVKVYAVGVCGTDFELIRGSDLLPYVGYPTIPGHEITGHVAEVNDKHTGFKEGDPVVVEQHLRCGHCYYCKIGLYFFCPEYKELGLNVNGADAEYVKAPIRNLIHAPTNIPLEHCLMAEPAATILRSLLKVGVRVTDNVVVLGAGPFGFSAVQLARALGTARVILVGRNRERLARGSEHGATARVSTMDTAWIDQVLAATTTGKPDMLIDCAGVMDLLHALIPHLAHQGRVVVMGLTHGQEIRVSADQMLLNEWVVAGTVSAMGHFEDGLAMLSSGRISAHPFITHEFPLAEYEKALGIMEQRVGGAIKVIVKP